MIYTFYAHAHLSRFYIRFKICVSGVGFGAATDLIIMNYTLWNVYVQSALTMITDKVRKC